MSSTEPTTPDDARTEVERDWASELQRLGETGGPPPSPWFRMSPSSRRRVTKAARPTYYIVLLAGAAAMIVPFLWMLSTSFKTEAAVFTFPPEWIPSPVRVENYTDAVTIAPFSRYFLNSLFVTFGELIGGLFVSAVAGYVFARMHFRGRDVLFIMVLATMMVPSHVELIPQFILMRELGWIDTFRALIVPGLFWPFGIFMLRQFFKAIPDELEDAMRMDGAGHLRILFGLMLPLSMPALAALAIFKFSFAWNSLIGPLIFINSQSKYTVTLGLAMFQGQYETRWALLMAATVLTLIPILLVFIIGQRYFIEGVTLSGLKR